MEVQGIVAHPVTLFLSYQRSHSATNSEPTWNTCFPICLSCPPIVLPSCHRRHIDMIFGYLANEKWLYQQVIDHGLAVEPTLSDFDSQEEYDRRHKEVLEGRRTSAMMIQPGR